MECKSTKIIPWIHSREDTSMGILLLCKHKDLLADRQYPCNTSGLVAHSCHPSAEYQGQVDPWGLAVYHTHTHTHTHTH